MREKPPLQAASIQSAARIFSCSPRLLYAAVQGAELSLCRTTGRRGVLILSDVEKFLRARVAPTRTRKESGDGNS
jgi:hypothetical protein